MRHLSVALIAAVSTIAFTQIASSADLGLGPIYGRPLLPMGFASPGWYVGLNAGAGWGNNDGIDNTANAVFCNTTLAGCNNAIPPNWAQTTAATVPLNFDTGNKAAFIGGGQIGYNFPTGALVWGIEADFQGTDINGSGSSANTLFVNSGNALPSFNTVAGTGSQKLNFLGTLRARLGWTPTPPWLFYLTGGLAYGHVETEVAFKEHYSVCLCGPDGFTSASNDEWRAGWTVGGGVEWMFAPRWSLKGEYLYYDLGHVTLDTVLRQANDVGTPFTAVGISSEAHYRGSIARGGVNYHF